MIKNPTNKPILLVDLDDTITDLVTDWIRIYNEIYGDNLKVENVTEWNIGKFTLVGEKMYDILKDPNLFKNVKIRTGATETLEWANEYFNIQIVSATSPYTYLDKANWVKEHLPFLADSFSAIIPKYLLKGDIMIDDKPDNLEYFDGLSIVFDRPWNRDNKKYLRVKDWETIKFALNLYLKNWDLIELFGGTENKIIPADLLARLVKVNKIIETFGVHRKLYNQQKGKRTTD